MSEAPRRVLRFPYPDEIDNVILKIVPGRTYRTRCGDIVHILGRNPVIESHWYWIGVRGTAKEDHPSDIGYPDGWEESGLHGGTARRKDDLVAEEETSFGQEVIHSTSSRTTDDRGATR